MVLFLFRVFTFPVICCFVPLLCVRGRRGYHVSFTWYRRSGHPLCLGMSETEWSVGSQYPLQGYATKILTSFQSPSPLKTAPPPKRGFWPMGDTRVQNTAQARKINTFGELIF
jgi:hypothetical protein